MGEGEAKAVQLAVVVPFYNEGTGAAAFLERLTGALAETERASPGGLDWRVIAVNDGSADDTLGVLLRARERDARICVVDLSRNFGKEYALTAGLDRAEGDVVVVMDGDGQHPPEMLSSMLAKWREGYEVVYMVREARRVRGLHRLLRAAFYRLFALASPIKLPPEAGDFRLMDRRVVRAIGRLPERTRFLKGIYSWVGFRQTGLRYREDERVNGASRWHFTRLFAFAMDALSAFSTLPLRLWSWIGAAVAGLSFLYAAWRVVRAIVWGIDVPGFETIVVSITFLGGMQLLSLGVLGGYIGRIFDEVKGRPLYIVRRSYGFPEDEAER
jgi:glycosyltransferase involved in cell wall biosynthesis